MSCGVSHEPTPKIFLCRAALKPFSAHSLFVLGIALTHVDNLAISTTVAGRTEKVLILKKNQVALILAGTRQEKREDGLGVLLF